MINEIWNLLLKMKDIKKEELIIDDYDKYIMKAFYKKLKGIIKYRLWKKIVIQYSIETGEDIFNSSNILVDEIYNKYKK